MLRLKDFTNRICIYHEGEVHKLFSIGYYKDWWYFISDFANLDGYHYLVSKINTPGTLWIGERMEMPVNQENTYTISVNNPKISHHIDGNSHISGDGIRSWYNEDGTPKGLSNKAGKLNDRNDGGPLFTFTVGLKALEFFPKIKIDNSLFKKTKCHL